jgi:hypothetical protein
MERGYASYELIHWAVGLSAVVLCVRFVSGYTNRFLLDSGFSRTTTAGK